MRIGPWILAAGLALLGAGIVSSGSDAWKRGKEQQSVTLDMAGVDALDIGKTRIDTVVLGNQGNALLGYSRWEWGGTDEAPKVSWKREGDVLVLDGKLEFGVAQDVSLRVPARIGRLAGRRLNVEAEAGVGSLRVESSVLTWKGDAGALDVRLAPARLGDCGDGKPARSATFEFKEGAVASLRVSIERGNLDLDDLSEVGEVELHAGDDVRLDVRRIGDLDKIRILPFDGMPSTAMGDDTEPEGDAGDDLAQAAAWAATCAAASVD